MLHVHHFKGITVNSELLYGLNGLTDNLVIFCGALIMKGNPLQYQEIHYYKRKPLTMQSLTVEGSPFLYKEVPWKSLTIDGNP